MHGNGLIRLRASPYWDRNGLAGTDSVLAYGHYYTTNLYSAESPSESEALWGGEVIPGLRVVCSGEQFKL